MKELKPGSRVRLRFPEKGYREGRVLNGPLEGNRYYIAWGNGTKTLEARSNLRALRKWRGFSEAQLYQQGYYHIKAYLNNGRSLLNRARNGCNLKAPDKLHVALEMALDVLEEALPEFGMYINLKKKEEQVNNEDY